MGCVIKLSFRPIVAFAGSKYAEWRLAPFLTSGIRIPIPVKDRAWNDIRKVME
jgi:hypothetical protein